MLYLITITNVSFFHMFISTCNWRQLNYVIQSCTLSPLSINKFNNFRFLHNTMYQSISKFAAYKKRRMQLLSHEFTHIWRFQISRVVLNVNCQTIRNLMRNIISTISTHFVSVRWLGLKIYALWKLFSKCIIFQSVL